MVATTQDRNDGWRCPRTILPAWRSPRSSPSTGPRFPETGNSPPRRWCPTPPSQRCPHAPSSSGWSSRTIAPSHAHPNVVTCPGLRALSGLGPDLQDVFGPSVSAPTAIWGVAVGHPILVPGLHHQDIETESPGRTHPRAGSAIGRLRPSRPQQCCQWFRGTIPCPPSPRGDAGCRGWSSQRHRG